MNKTFVLVALFVFLGAVLGAEQVAPKKSFIPGEYAICNLFDASFDERLYTPFIEQVSPGHLLMCWEDKKGVRTIETFPIDDTFEFVNSEKSVPTIWITRDRAILYLSKKHFNLLDVPKDELKVDVR